MRTSARVVTTLLTTTIVVAGTATAASAQATTTKDSAGGVVSYADDKDEQGTQLSKAASAASGVDIRSLKVDHGKKKVVVTLKVRNLKKDTVTSIAFRPNSKKQPNRVLVNTGRKSGEVYDQDYSVTCAVPLKTKYGKNGYVKATIKRSCLGSPKKIRVTAVTFRGAGDGTEAGVVDTLSKGNPRTEVYTKGVKAS